MIIQNQRQFQQNFANQYYPLKTNTGSSNINMSFRGGLNNNMLNRIAHTKSGCGACGK